MRGHARASSVSGIVSVTTISSSSDAPIRAHRASGEHRVRAVGDDLLRAVLLQRRRRLAQRVRGVDDVVHDHAGASLDVADDVHHFGDVRPRPPLVDDREVRVEPLRDRARAHHAADVRRHDEQVLVVLLPQVAQQDRRRVDVVDRDVEESLDLVGVQVHHHHALNAHGGQHVGDHLRGDRHARRARAAVLPRVAEIRHAAVMRAGRRALQRIDHHHELHQVVVGRRARRLQHEHVAAADVLEELDHHLAVGELADDAAPEADVEMPADGLGEPRVRVAGEDAHALERHGPPLRESCPEEWLGRKDSNLRMPESKSAKANNPESARVINDNAISSLSVPAFV